MDISSNSCTIILTSVMARSVRSSLKLLFKLVNAVFGILGFCFLVFSFWLLRVWQREVAHDSTASNSVPWFVYALLGVGVGLGLMACIGHLAADAASGFCLSFYLAIIFALTMFEIAFAADVYMNSDWEEDLPGDPTGMLDDIADYVESHSMAFRWLGLSIVFAQVLSVLLTIMLKNMGPQYNSDDDYVAPRQPLLHHPSGYPVQAPSFYFGADPSIATADESWKFQFQRREVTQFD